MVTAGTATMPPPMHSLRQQRRRHFNRMFAAIYSIAILCLFYHHIITLLHSTTIVSFLISLSLFISDAILAFMWSTCQAFRLNSVNRTEHPEYLEKFLDRNDYPAIDIFICTADPFKEPPISVVNTALSVMAYDYRTEKLSVYVSDDGGSELTMFAFMEAAKFGKYWLPFCRENNISERCPDAFFSSTYSSSAKTEEIKMMYEKMKVKVETAVEKGKVGDEYICEEGEREALSKFRSKDFTRQNHPAVIQILLNSKRDQDVVGQFIPNLIYVSREKNKSSPHHFKAGALNSLLRVSAVITNSPIILTLDCDMYSNDPSTIQRVLCYLPDKSNKPNCGYVQIPQIFHGLNKNDIYASEHKRLFIQTPTGLDGMLGPSYVGTGCFFNRRVFFGSPSSYIQPEIPDLGPNNIVDKPINCQEVLSLAHYVAGCNYESRTMWGSKIGFRYGSLVEDYYTAYRLHCEGWQSIFCNPLRPAFLGDAPISLIDGLGQEKRWAVGLLEVGFSKYNPLTYGIRKMGIFMGQGYAQNAYWATWSFPVIVYSFLPSLTLLNTIPIFPKVYDPWSLLYLFLFLGAYGQDYIEFMLAKGTFKRWWNDQKMWLIRGLSAYPFATIEYISDCLGLPSRGFSLTSKVMDGEQSKRYDQGIFDFGVHSPIFVPFSMAAILNLVALFSAIFRVIKGNNLDSFFIQMAIAGFGVLNSLQIYEAMALRVDKGRIATQTTVMAVVLLGVLCAFASLILKTCN